MFTCLTELTACDELLLCLSCTVGQSESTLEPVVVMVGSDIPAIVGGIIAAILVVVLIIVIIIIVFFLWR